MKGKCSGKCEISQENVHTYYFYSTTWSTLSYLPPASDLTPSVFSHYGHIVSHLCSYRHSSTHLPPPSLPGLNVLLSGSSRLHLGNLATPYCPLSYGHLFSSLYKTIIFCSLGTEICLGDLAHVCSPWIDSFTSFWSLLKCHLTGDSFFNHPFKNISSWPWTHPFNLAFSSWFLLPYYMQSPHLFSVEFPQ